MTGYVRSFDKTDGVDPIRSGDFESEFTAIETAFNQSSGHKHDGTVSEGPYISIIGDTTAKDKVVIDGTNHEIEFWNNVGGSAVQQVIVKDGVIEPTTNNDIDLGSSTKYFKNIYGNIFEAINVKAYGARGDGSTDDTTYIQNALDAAYSAGGGTVLLPVGTFVCSGITIGSNVTLMGVGNGSVLYHKDNSTNHLIQLETLDTLNIGLKNFTINGNSSNQTSVVDAIYLTGAGGTSGLIRRHTISDLYIHHVKGNGIFHSTYQRECVIHNVNTYYCDGYGIWLNGPDSQVSDCTTGQSGKYGFYITGGAYSISNVKSWCSGRISAGYHGFYLKDAQAVTIDGLYAQENSGYGVLIEGTSSASEHILVRGIIDSNNTSAGTNGALGLNNVDEAIIDVVIRSGLAGYTHHYGITVDSDVTNSHIKVACSSDELTSWLIYGNFSDSCTFSIPVLNSSATNGNVSATLNATLSKTTQIWNTPLTTDRTVTLGTGSAVWTGATFHIVRTAAATGAYNLNVGTGPLKALTAGTWCDVTFDGSAWILSGYGAL